MSYTEHLIVPAFSYISVIKGLKHNRCKEFGPREMAEVFNLADGSSQMMEVIQGQIIVDLDINDNVIGVEFLVDTDLQYEVQSEHDAPGPYCIHSIFQMDCIPCAHRHLWLLQQHTLQGKRENL